MLKYPSIISNFLGPIVVLVINLIKGTIWYLSILDAVLYFVVSFAFFTLTALLIILIPVQIMGNNPKPHSKFRWWLILTVAEFCLYWLNIKVNPVNIESIPKDRKIIFYSNHQGLMDIFSLYVALKEFPHSEVFKKEYLKNPIVRGTALMLGGVALDRENDREAAKSVIKTIKLINENNQTFLVFPEGTRTKDGAIHEYKAGSFKIAEKTGCDIVIMVIDNSYKIHKDKFFKRTIIDIRVAGIVKHEDFPATTIELANIVQTIATKDLEKNRAEKPYLSCSDKYFK